MFHLTLCLWCRYTTDTSIACAARFQEACLYFHLLAEQLLAFTGQFFVEKISPNKKGLILEG